LEELSSTATSFCSRADFSASDKIPATSVTNLGGLGGGNTSWLNNIQEVKSANNVNPIDFMM
jgi:hypothetical protein